MPKGIMVVESEAGEPGAEDEYHRWYREEHIPELLSVPGFVGARRYRVRQDLTAPEVDKPRYLAVYELEADDLADPLRELRARAEARAAASDGEESRPRLSASTVVTVYELMEE